MWPFTGRSLDFARSFKHDGHRESRFNLFVNRSDTDEEDPDRL
jgi:hypothetical protein